MVRRRWITLSGVAALSMSLLGPAAQAEGPGKITDFPLAAPASASRITPGPDGNLWFTQDANNKVSRITTTGQVTDFPLPTPNSVPLGITAGPDGNLWFTESVGNKIGRITPTGTITEFPIPTGASQPVGITAGPDGNVWFTESFANKIGRITPTGDITEFPIPTGASGTRSIAAGADGNLWFAESNAPANKIGRITPTGTITEFPIPTPGSNPQSIVAGPDANMWFAQPTVNRIGRIGPDGTISEYTVPTLNSLPLGMATGPDGNLWSTGVAKPIRISTSGTMTEFPGSGGTPLFITAGPDGNMWYTSSSPAKVSKITTGFSPSDRKPGLAGSGQADLPLLCAADVWGPSSTVTVAWQRNGQAIAGQTGLTYTPSAADIGASITCSSTGLLPGMLTGLTATSNPVTVVAQLSGPPGPGGTLAAVLAPGAKTVKAGKTLKVQYGVTNAVPLTAQLKGKKTVTKQVQAKAGTNTLKWKLPKKVKPGKYTLRLLFQGTSKASTKVKVTK